MQKGSFIGASFEDKTYFLCSKIFCSKVKFTIVYYSKLMYTISLVIFHKGCLTDENLFFTEWEYE